jgi:glycerate 2-kinase
MNPMQKQQINILVAPNSMKGSLSAFEFADVLEEAFLKVSDNFSIRKVPVADGGDFTGQVLQKALGAQTFETTVMNPFGKPVASRFAVAGQTAVIEMADASGIKLLMQDELNPMDASSFGTGQLIAAAIAKGCTQILLGAGGAQQSTAAPVCCRPWDSNFTTRRDSLLMGQGRILVKFIRLLRL